jgi:arabinose-5-phosphate isomerase
VRDVMRTGKEMPRVGDDATLMEGVLEMSRGRMGITAVLDGNDRVVGVFTDGDLRRTLEKGTDVRTARIAKVMTREPRTIGPDKLAVEAVEIMERFKVNQLLVVDAGHKLLGALNMHDLFRAKVI